MRLHHLLATLLFSSVSHLALAQDYSNVITFGDSLSDNGNLAAFGAAPPPPYYNGRFSNGPTSVEILAGQLHPQNGPNGTMYNVGQAALGGNVNYAFGGARADTSFGSGVPPIPTQLNLFAGQGGMIGPNSLVTLQGGANDIFQSGPSAIPNSAAQMGVTMNRLGMMGTRNLLVMNLPDLGATPAFAGAASAAGTAMTNSYNTLLLAQVNAARAANPDMNIIYLDTQRVVAHILANPAAFGFTNTTAQCVMTAACVGGSAATQNQYFFWDSVHPTAAAHRIFAAIQQQMVQYGYLAKGVSSLAEQSLASRHGLVNRSFDRIAQARYGAMPSEKGEMRLEALFDYQSGNGYNGHAEGAQLSYARSSSSEMAYGGALSAQFGTIKQGLLSYQPVSLSIDGWLTRKYGASFVNIAAGASYNSYSGYKREAGIGNFAATAAPDGNAKAIAMQLGHGIKMGTVTYTPSGTFSLVNAKVGGYAETGIVAPLRLSERSLTAFTGAAEIRADLPLSVGLMGHGLIGYQQLLALSGNRISATLADQPVKIYTNDLKNIAASGVYLGAGVGGKAAGFAYSLDYRASYMNGANHKVTGGLKLVF